MARDYGAEYRARQARYKIQYGVSYNEYRRIASKAKSDGISGEKVRKALGNIKGQGGNPKQVIGQILERKEVASTQYRSGGDVDFDIEQYEDFDLDDDWFWYH